MSSNSQKSLKSCKGFTFLEMLVVITIILVAFTGIYTLLTKVVYVSKISIHKLTATMLAQEGIEIVRNIRETNWLHGKAWDDGLIPDTYIVQYDSSSLQPFEDKYLILNKRLILYSYTEEVEELTEEQILAGMRPGVVESLFKRRIDISDNPDRDPSTEDIAITCQVTWEERGRPQSILLEDWLYDWRSRE